MIGFIIACTVIAVIGYALGFLVVARRAALSELYGMKYAPYDLGDYAGAGLWGLLIGAFWPVLAVAIVFGAGVGWLLTRFVKTNGGRA